LDEIEILAKTKLEETKKQLEDLGDEAEEILEAKVAQIKSQYQTVEDELESRYKGFLNWVRNFFKKLLS